MHRAGISGIIGCKRQMCIRDSVLAVHPAKEDTHLVLHTTSDYMLRFSLAEIPVQKKAAGGVRGIRLTGEEQVSTAFYLDEQQIPEVEVNGKKVHLNRLRIGSRDTRGSKARG